MPNLCFFGKKEQMELSKITIIAELIEEFKLNPKLEAAFYKLTPGRQRGYLLYFSGAKQSATRVSRIQKYATKILSGKGFQD